MRFSISNNEFATLVSVYTPTMTNQKENKEAFYQQIHEVIYGVSAGDKLIIPTDFNMQTGSNHTMWTGIISQHGVGHESSNGKLLFSLCSQRNFSITNTFFHLKKANKTTLMYSKEKHWHQMDLIMCRQWLLPE